ncbi:MAG: cytochrome C biogenesis protein, partial [Pseudomonadota bacterium]
MQKIIPYLVVAFIYLAVAADFWRTPKATETQPLKLHSAMIALGLLIHGGLLYQSIFAEGFNLGFYIAVSAIFWLTVLIYWLADLKHQLTNLQAFVLPPAAIFALLPAFAVSDH